MRFVRCFWAKYARSGAFRAMLAALALGEAAIDFLAHLGSDSQGSLGRENLELFSLLSPAITFVNLFED